MRPTPLRETPSAAPQGAQIIDARYELVGGKQRGFLGTLRLACVALFWAALIGFLIPPAWVMAERLFGH